VVTRVPLVYSLADLGALAEGIAHGEDAVRLAEMAGQPFSLVMAYDVLGYVYLVIGDLDKGISVLAHGLDICRNAQVTIFLSQATAYVGYAYLLSGRVAEALPLLEHAVNQSTYGLRELLHRSWLSEAYRLTSRKEKAIEVAQQTLSLARDRKERGHEAWVLRGLGEIASYKDSPDFSAAEVYYNQALALAKELGMRPLIAHCHVGLGKLYRHTGDSAQAKAHLGNGVAMMREMAMGLWLERAEAELKELS
jgi:tetratricopeptide (TPR) repeat protein